MLHPELVFVQPLYGGEGGVCRIITSSVIQSDGCEGGAGPEGDGEEL